MVYFKYPIYNAYKQTLRLYIRINLQNQVLGINFPPHEKKKMPTLGIGYQHLNNSHCSLWLIFLKECFEFGERN